MSNEALVRDVATMAARYKLQAWKKENEYNERNLAAKDPLESFRAGLACGLAIAYQTASEECAFALKINAIYNFPENAHEALADGWTEFARAESEDGN